MKNTILLVALLFIASSWGLAQQHEARMLRFPAIHGQNIVFSYAGDLYTVSRQGGLARKITSDIGSEIFPRFSPDGSQIAFTGQYDGNTEVCIIPATGGTPRRLTYTATLSRDELGDRMGPNNIVMGWSPDGKYIIYRSRCQSFNDFKGKLFKVSPDGGLPEEIPLSCAGFCSVSPDGTQLAFNQIFREFRTWKYYTGGMTDDIWLFDFNSRAVTNLTNNPAQNIFPMWHGRNIFFLSDRDRRMNLFAYNLDSEQTRKLTHFEDFDIKFPSLGDGVIVFEKGGSLFTYDIAQDKTQQINISLADDDATPRNEWKDASQYITWATVSPQGERVLFSARGEIYSVPAKSGVTRNLTRTPGAHDRTPVWSPDGTKIAWLSDQSGEYEIYMLDLTKNDMPVKLTTGADTYKYELMWSPDSRKLLCHDRMFRLFYIDIETKRTTLVAQSKTWEITDYQWSPDSRWISFVMPEEEGMGRLFLYQIATGQATPVTDGWYTSASPAFSPDGKYLFFVSGREFNPTYSQTEWNHAYVNMEKIYLLLLSNATVSPFAPENNEEKQQSGKESGAEDKSKPSEKEFIVDIDLDGIQQRLVALPVPAGQYFSLQPAGQKLFYAYRTENAQDATVKYYDLEKKEEKTVATGISFVISASGNKMLVRKGSDYFVTDLPSGEPVLKDKVPMGDMKLWVDMRAEWSQIYYESWRQMRDFFFAPNMHGTDWLALRDKYAVLLPHINHRDDLTYLIGELIGELNIGHAYVNSGDKPRPARIPLGLLGARLSRHSSGYFRIDSLLEGANWSPQLRSPLTESGVNAQKGEYIIAINGTPVNTVDNVYSLLINKANVPVEMILNTKPQPEGGRTVLVVPTDKEGPLYYYNQIQHNIRYVSEKTDGQVGYIHIPDMSSYGLNEFARHFYPQLRKKGLIIDDRGNGGGNVSPMIIERLTRQMVFSDVIRNQQYGHPNPGETHVGPKVMLIDCYSASDGDLFPFRFKLLKLGTVIGTQTWGGITGIRGSLPFVDGGDLRKPEFAKYYSIDGQFWPVEGTGIAPDIVIANDPALEYLGTDHQLDKAIEVILQQIKDYKGYIQPIPPYPDKSK